MSEKESFLLYKSFYEPTKHLSKEDKADLYDAIFCYQIDGKEPKPTSSIFPFFLFFKNQFRLDQEKYSKRAERNRVNGSKGGRPKKSKNPKNPVGFKEPKKGDNDNDNEKDNDNDNVNEKDSNLKKEEKALEKIYQDSSKVENLSKKEFEEIYRNYQSPKQVRVVPYDKKKKVEKCLTDLSYQELNEQIKNYNTYLETADWRQKKSFDAFVNDPEMYGNDWIKETELEADRKEMRDMTSEQRRHKKLMDSYDAIETEIN